MSSDTPAPAAPTPIIVWCHPRSCSTAFERALMQRADTHVFHEPLGDPFYYSQSRQCHRYNDETCRATPHWTTSLDEVTRSLLVASSHRPHNLAPNKDWPPRFVFIKDMAQYIFPANRLRELHPESKVYPSTPSSAPAAASVNDDGNPTVLPTWLLRRFKHTFLIRTPEKSVPSYWKCVQEKAAGFEYFDGAEAGYAELRILYDWIADPKSAFNTHSENDGGKDGAAAGSRPGVVQEQPLPPPLIDAKVLLAHPEHVVSSYCSAVGIPFDRQMLSWESGPVEEWKKWGSYHKGAENSTGFLQTSTTTTTAAAAADTTEGAKGEDKDGESQKATEEAKEKAEEKKAALPEEVKKTIEDCLPDYLYLAGKTTVKEP